MFRLHAAATCTVVFVVSGWTIADKPDARPVTLPTKTGRFTLAPNGKTLMTDRFTTWDVETGKEMPQLERLADLTKRLSGEIEKANPKAFLRFGPFANDEPTIVHSPKGDLIGMCVMPQVKRGGGAVTPPYLLFLDAKTGKEVHRLPSKAGVFAFLPDGKQVAVAEGKKINTYDVATGKLEGSFDGAYQICDMAVAPKADMLAYCDRYGGLELRKLPLGEKLDQDPSKKVGGNNRFGVATFSPDGKTLAFANHEGVYSWETSTAKKRWGVEAPLDWKSACRTLAIAVSADGVSVATIRELKHDGKSALQIWRNGKEHLKKEGAFQSIAFLPNGKTLLVGTENAIEMWKVD